MENPFVTQFMLQFCNSGQENIRVYLRKCMAVLRSREGDCMYLCWSYWIIRSVLKISVTVNIHARLSGSWPIA